MILSRSLTPMTRFIRPINSHSAFLIKHHSTKPNQYPTADELKSTDLPPLLPSQPLPDNQYLRNSFPELGSISPNSLKFQNADGEIVEKPDSWYYIERTKSNQLPTYPDVKASGRVNTIIRKIQGNTSQLRMDLIPELGITKKDIRIKTASNQIVIKGNYTEQVKEILGKYF